MPRWEPLNPEQTRLLKIAARMPLASVANLAPVLGLDEERVRRMLARLRSGGWVVSVVRGMTERRQYRWFLTRKAVEMLYVTDHQHPSPREEASPEALASSHPQGELPQDFQERFALDHDHPPHLEGSGDSPFAAGEGEDGGENHDHEHPPWTATSRGWRCPCAASPCWSRSTDWPPTCSGSAGSACPPATMPPGRSG